jgi:hypothetical protein
VERFALFSEEEGESVWVEKEHTPNCAFLIEAVAMSSEEEGGSVCVEKEHTHPNCTILTHLWCSHTKIITSCISGRVVLR